MITHNQRIRAHKVVDMIFQKLFPEHGMKERAGQIELCHNMLSAMFEKKIMLSDAGTGLGKTYAYLVAAVVFCKYLIASAEPRQPIVISTARVALQEAIQKDYLPFLSKLLISAGYITGPLVSIVRKGKSRYVCDERLQTRLKQIDLDKKNKRDLEALLSLKACLDMDHADHLSGFDRRLVAVPHTCNCTRHCRYKRFLEDAASDKYLFQIRKHNLLLEDAMNKKYKRSPILRPYCALIVDEAHKLPSAARQMFGRTLGREDVRPLNNGLKSERYNLAAQNLKTAMQPILEGIAAETEDEAAAFERDRLQLLKAALKTLESIRRMTGDTLTKTTRRELTQMIATLNVFIDEESDIILYVDQDEYQQPLLCAVAADLSAQMEQCLWSMPQPILLTSGTLDIGDDFSRFKEEACIGQEARLAEVISPSPFAYEKNCLLYVPYRAPCPCKGNSQAPYYRALTWTIVKLLQASRGHALILFNSYDAMAAIHGMLKARYLSYPIFAMIRNDSTVTERFKESGNGVLLATGSAWEGMDFPGDIVSMLIIPRLPFPIPDAFSNHLKDQYSFLKEFIHAVALPDMQIKLRQGFGRAIRLETDTCVVAILDDRATRDSRYHDAMREALPEMPMTGLMEVVEDFFRQHKSPEYFFEKVV